MVSGISLQSGGPAASLGRRSCVCVLTKQIQKVERPRLCMGCCCEEMLPEGSSAVGQHELQPSRIMEAPKLLERLGSLFLICRQFVPSTARIVTLQCLLERVFLSSSKFSPSSTTRFSGCTWEPSAGGSPCPCPSPGLPATLPAGPSYRPVLWGASSVPWGISPQHRGTHPHMRPGPAVTVGDTGGGSTGPGPPAPPSAAAGGPEPPQSPTPAGADRARHGHTAAPHHRPAAVTGATSGCGRSPPPCRNAPAPGTRACCPPAGAAGTHQPRRVPGSAEYSRSAAAGVLVPSRYPPGPADDNGEPSDSLVLSVLDAACRYAIKVAFHIQPYKGHDDHTMHENIRYIMDKYRSHAAFYKSKTGTGNSLPLFYIYDSYLTLVESANVLTPGSHFLCNTSYNAVFIVLLVEEGHKHEILSAGYDGMYTYFVSNGFSFGSSHQNWNAIKTFCDSNKLMFIPSVGPGYIDSSIRPWNNHNTRNRVNGKYYETALRAALTVRLEIVSITSFNTWHEGTQIKKVVPKKTLTRLYLDYLPHQPSTYLELTRRAEHCSKEKTSR
ncbi:LOW QUALITY PROTEIN: glycoprotein endo-alpha-1,2-mannosidase-like protein [Morphnus guianensis]